MSTTDSINNTDAADRTTQQLAAMLKTWAYSLTRPRRIVFEALQNKEPQTMHELVAACDGRVDRASVYRTIALFEKLGIVQRLQIGWKYKLELSDHFQRHHHHVTCSNCGKTVPLTADETLEQRLRLLASQQGFRVQSHQVEMQGLCQACRQSHRTAN